MRPVTGFALYSLTLLLLLSSCHLLAPVNTPYGMTEDPPVVETLPQPPEPTPAPANQSQDREQTLRSNIVEYAQTFLGTNYLYAGRSPQTGFDCSGFTHFVLAKFGIDLPPVSRSQEGQGRQVAVQEVQPGDLIFYRRSANSQVFHVSLVVANEPDGIYVIHSVSNGVSIDNITTSSYWAPKISTARDVVSGKF